MAPAARRPATKALQSVLPSQSAGSVPLVSTGRPKATQAQPKHQPSAAGPGIAAAPPSIATKDREGPKREGKPGELDSLDTTLAFMQALRRKTYADRPTKRHETPRHAMSRSARASADNTAPSADVQAASTATSKRVAAFQSSVADQMLALSQSTSQLVSSLSRFKPGEVVVKKLCTKFQVAALTSQCTSMVTFFTDRAEYKFKHDKLGIVRMIMYYKDTADLVVDRRRQLLSFHVFNPLENFADHYNHRDPSQRIVIRFTTRQDLIDVELAAIPVIHAARQ